MWSWLLEAFKPQGYRLNIRSTGSTFAEQVHKTKLLQGCVRLKIVTSIAKSCSDAHPRPLSHDSSKGSWKQRMCLETSTSSSLNCMCSGARSSDAARMITPSGSSLQTRQVEARQATTAQRAQLKAQGPLRGRHAAQSLESTRCLGPGPGETRPPRRCRPSSRR